MTPSTLCLPSILLAGLCLPLAASAADRTWSGAGTDALWSTSANWGGTAPVSGDALRFDGSARPLNTNDYAAATAFSGITFLSAADAFVLAGNLVKLGGDVINQSAATQTVGTPLVIDATADRYFNTANGPIVFSSSLNYNVGTTARSYKKTGTNELVFTGTTLVTNSYNRFALDEGTMRFVPGSRFDLVDTSNNRDIFRIGNVANKQSAMIIESNATVAIGGVSLQMTAVAGGTGTFDLLVDGGTLALTGTDNTFGDQNGNRATLVIDRGGLLTNTSASAYISFGTRIPASLTIEDGRAVIGQLSFGRNNTSGDRKGGRSDVTIKKGDLTILTKLYSNTTSDPARTNVITLGDGRIGLAKFSTPNISRPDTNGRVILNFNGGVLECLNSHTTDFLGSPNEVNLLAGGVIVDTQANSVTIPNTFTRDASIPPGVRDGGLTKRGSGSLTLNGAAVQFNGSLRVEDGSLRISAAMLSDLEAIDLAPGKTLSFRGSYQQALVPEHLVLGNASTASRMDFDANTDGSACDTIHIPAGGYVGKLNVYLKLRGATDTDLSTPGDYPLFTYATEPPDLSLLSHANRTFGTVSYFVVDRVNKAVILRLAVSDAETTWINTGSGDWETASNWSPASPAGTPASRAHFWSAITAPATVTLSTDTRIGGFSFNNSQSYTLAGTGVLSVGDQNGGGYVISDAGSHAINLPLNLLAPITVNVPTSQTLTLNGAVAGDGGIVKGNPGTLLLTNANTFAGGVKITAGTVTVPAAEALGTGPLTLAGGTANLTAAGSYTLSNNLYVQTNGVLNIGSATVAHPGTVDWIGNGTLTKQGSGELTLSGSCSETGSGMAYNFREGTTRLVGGASYSLRGGNRDVLQTTYSANGQTSSLVIEPGAYFTASGMRLMTGGSIGTSTVHVAGGTLNLMDSESTIVNVTGGRADILVDNGGSLYAATGWFSLGVNGLGTLAVSNGTASVSLFTAAGYGDNVGAGNRKGSALVTVGPGGVFEVRDYFNWINDNQSNVATVRLDGGRLITPNTARSTGSTGTATLILDGGTLDCAGLAPYSSPYAQVAPSLDNYLFGVNSLQLGADGITIDTRLHAITITQPLVMEAGAATATGFTKAGAGTLTLAGANAFDAPVTVEAGTLVLQALPDNSLTVAAGATIDPSADTIQTETVTTAAFGNGAALALDLGAADASDRLAVTGALTLDSRLNVSLKGDSQAGVFTLFTYGSLSGSATALRVANPDPDFTYAFADTGSAITLTVAANANVARWANDADGYWSTATNWDPQTAPNGSGHTARFDVGFTATRTATLDSAATVGALLFDSATAPILAGTATLTLDNGDSPALIEADQGAPVVLTPLALAGDTFTLIDSAATLTLSGNVGGNGTLNAIGGGALVLNGTNTAAQTTVSGSTLALGPDASQESPLVLDDATLTSAVTRELGEAITAGAFGATVIPADGTTLTLSGAIDGDGSVAKSGSSTLALTGALSYRGITTAAGGTLALVTPPPAGLTLGAGTLAYSGPDANLPGHTLNVGTGKVAAVLASSANLTVTGQVAAVAGGFVKTGSGTLVFAYPGSQTLALANDSAVSQDAMLNIGANGDAPTQGFGPFSIAEGTVYLGAPGQVNTLLGNLLVGLYTTGAASAETAAHLIVTGGTTTVTSNIAVGRGNGNTVSAPTPLESTLTVEDGTLSIGALSLGHNGGNTVGFNARPSVTVNGGSVTVGQINLAEHLGSVASLTLNGGALAVTDLIRIGHQTSNGGGGTGTLTVNGGTMTVLNDINLGVTASATGTLHLAGGLTSARNVAVGSGTGTILFDGGALSLVNGPMVGVQAQVMAGGALLDVQSGRFTMGVPLIAGEAGDGGLTKTGAGMLAFDNTADSTFTGPTLVSEGTLALRGNTANLPAATALTVAPGAALHLSSEAAVAPRLVTVSGLTLGSVEASAEDAGLGLWLSANSLCDSLSVGGTPTLGHVAVYAYQAGSLDTALYNGVYTILSYTGDDPDIANLSVANPNPARDYAFSVDSGNKRVLLTISDSGSVAADAIWIHDGDGDWSSTANWQNDAVPNGLTTPVLFNGIISEPRTVNVDVSASIGGLTFNSTNRYSLSGTGTLTLSSDAPAITAQSGSHSIASPLAVADSARVTLQPNGNTLTLAGSVTGAGAALELASAGTVQLTSNVVDTALTVDTGTLELTGDATVTGTLQYNGGQITSTGNASLDGTVELPPGTRSLRANAGATLTVNGAVLGLGQLYKDSGGTVVLAAANAYEGGTRIIAGTLAFSGQGTPGTGAVTMEGGVLGSTGSAPVAFGNPIGFTNNPTVQADAPLATGGDLTLPSPRSVTKEGSNTWSVGGALVGGGTNDAHRVYIRNGTFRFDEGSEWCAASTTPTNRNQWDASVTVANRAMGLTIESNATVTAGSLGVQFGSVLPGSFDLVMNGGRFVLTVPDNPLGLGDSSNAVISVTVNGGEWTTVSDAAYCDLGTRSPVTWVQNGGLVSFGRPAFGRQNGAGAGRLFGGMDMTINGGTFEARQFFSWKSTDYAYVTNTVTLGSGAAREGRFSVPATKRYSSAGRVVMNMRGGVLETRGLCSPDGSLNGSLSDYLYGVDEINVLAGGAVVDTLTNSVTILQTLAPGAEGDGGVTKLGPGKLTLAADVALTGRVTVAEGTLDAAFTSTPDLNVQTNGTLDLSQAASACAFRNVSGTGTATNGTLAVTGTLSAGYAAGEAGVFHAQNLELRSGMTLRYDWTAETNDLFAVSGALTAQGSGFIDFGRDANDVLAIPFTAVLGTYGGAYSGTFSGWRAINTGLPANSAVSTVIKAENGVVTLNVAYSGLMILVR